MKTIFILFLIIWVCFINTDNRNVLAESMPEHIERGSSKSFNAQEPNVNGVNKEKGINNRRRTKKLPDLTITDLNIICLDKYRVLFYEFTVKNIGTEIAHLHEISGGLKKQPTVSHQAFLSEDNIFNNNGDIAAGGSIFAPAGDLMPGEQRSLYSSSALRVPSSQDLFLTPFLTLKVDWGDVVNELDETNNTKAVLIEPDKIRSTNDDIIALFLADIREGVSPLSVQFKDISLGDINSWSWNFGDGSFSSKQNPIHEYANDGEFTVSLTVSGKEANSTITQDNFIFTMDCSPSLQSIVVDNTQTFELAKGDIADEIIGMQKRGKFEIENKLDIWLGVLEIISSVEGNDLIPADTLSEKFIIMKRDTDTTPVCSDLRKSTWTTRFCFEGTIEVLIGLTPLSISINLLSHLIEFDLCNIENILSMASELETNIPNFNEAVECFSTLSETSIDCAKTAIDKLIEDQQQLDLLVQMFIEAEMKITRLNIDAWSSKIDLMDESINMLIEAGSNFYIKIID